MNIERAVAFVEGVRYSRPGFVEVQAQHSATVHTIVFEVPDQDQPRIGDRLRISIKSDEK